MNALPHFLTATVRIGEPTAHRNLTLFPLFCPEPAHPGYVLLDEAIARGAARVTEVSQSGSVPELLLVNDGEWPVLLLDGEELTGAKQNRVLNLTILAPAKTTLRLPVSCVEERRWHYDRPDFVSAAHAQYPSARAGRAAQVSRSMRAGASRAADQGAVWAEIGLKAARMAAASPTGAMHDIYATHDDALAGYTEAFRAAPGQTGVLFAMDGRAKGFDLFDHSLPFARVLPKLVRGYALDALDSSSPCEGVAPGGTATRMLARAAAAGSFTQNAIGLGQDIRLESDQVSGGALHALGRFLHVYAFRRGGHSSGVHSTRIRRPSERV